MAADPPVRHFKSDLLDRPVVARLERYATIREEHSSRNYLSLIGGQMVILRQQMRSKPERTDDVLAALAAIVLAREPHRA